MPSLSIVCSTDAPKWRSIDSLWSRDACGSITVVVPRAFNPASKIADLICAEATLERYWSAIGVTAPVIVTGKRPPSRQATDAPISARGSVIRAIGRTLNEASPQKVAVMFCPATTPINSRAPVPELPRSSGVTGETMPFSPTPVICHIPSSSRRISAPSATSAFFVEITSAPSSRPLTLVMPMARLPRISERCEIDLSPGIGIVPRSEPALCETS